MHQNLYSLTYHVKDANGKPCRIRDMIDGPPTYTLSRELSDEEVKAFNPWNLLRAALRTARRRLGSRPACAPSMRTTAAMSSACPSPVLRPAGGVAGGGPFVSRAVAPYHPHRIDRVQPLAVNPVARRARGYPRHLVLRFRPGYPQLHHRRQGHRQRQQQDQPRRVGHRQGQGRQRLLRHRPRLRGTRFIDPPKFTAEPVDRRSAAGKVAVQYALDLGGAKTSRSSPGISVPMPRAPLRAKLQSAAATCRCAPTRSPKATWASSSASASSRSTTSAIPARRW